MTSFYRQHMSHCDQGDYEGSCKYGDDDCPALTPAPDKLPELQQAAKDALAELASVRMDLSLERWGELYNTILAAIAYTPTRPQPAVLDEQREAIARMVDPSAFRSVEERLADTADWVKRRWGADPEKEKAARELALDNYNEAEIERRSALRTADAILAHIASTTAAAVQAETERCAKVADEAVFDWVNGEAITPPGKAHQNAARLIAERIRTSDASEGGAA